MKLCNKCDERPRISYKSYCRECYNKMQRDLRKKQKANNNLKKSVNSIGWRWYYNLWCD